MKNTQNYATKFTVDESPEEVFTAINNVRGWWSGSFIGDADLLGRQRCRTGFLFARLRFGYSRGWRFGWRLLRGRRCLFGSLWFLFVSNDHLLRMDLPDKNKAAD